MQSRSSSVQNDTPFAAPDRITVVSGLPRAGTSLMMQLLAAAGLPIAVDGARPADADNPRGYFELEAVRRIDRDATFLDGCRGRAVKIVAPLIRALPSRYTYRVVFVERDLREILASQRAMLARGQAESGAASAVAAGEGRSDAALARAFAALLEDSRRFLVAAPNVEVLFVAHRALMEDPGGGVGRLVDFLVATSPGGSGGAAGESAGRAALRARAERAMVAVIDRGLHRRRV